MRAKLCFLALLLSLFILTGCGGAAGGFTTSRSQSSGGGSGSGGSTTNQTISLFVTDAASDQVGSFHIGVTAASLVKSDGSSVSLYSGTARTLELRHLQLAPTLALSATVPANTYSSLFVTFSSPTLQTVNAAGQTNSLTSSSSPSVSLKTASVTIPLSFQLPSSTQAGIMIDVDLSKSLSTDSNGNFTFDPVVTASLVSDTDIGLQLVGAEGPVSNVTSSGFDFLASDSGLTVHVVTDSTTQFASAIGSASALQSGQNIRLDAKFRSDGDYVAKFVNPGPPSLTSRQNGLLNQAATSNGLGGYTFNILTQN